VQRLATFKLFAVDMLQELDTNFVEACRITYPADGVDNISEELNGSKDDYATPDGKAFINDPLTQLTSLLGLPNRQLKANQRQSWLNVAKNFIGWQEDVSTNGAILNAILMTPLNLIATPLKFAGNFLKLGTEVVPYTLSMLLSNYAIKSLKLGLNTMLTIEEDQGRLKTFANILLGIGIMIVGGALFLSGAVIKNLYHVLRAASSPIESVRIAWATGNASGGKLGLALGSLYVAASIAATLACYVIFFHVAFKVLAPIITSVLPKVITSSISVVAKALTPALTAIGNVTAPVVSYMVKAFTMHAVSSLGAITSMRALVGLSAVIAIATTTIGAGIDRAVAKFKLWWHGQPRVAPSADITPLLSSESSQQESSLSPPAATPVIQSTDRLVNLRLSASSEKISVADNSLSQQTIPVSNEVKLKLTRSHSYSQYEEQKIEAPSKAQRRMSFR
jgi:hypothetical protein